MDIGANSYSFKWFLCFLTLKLHPRFLSHNFSHSKKSISYKETFDKISFQNKVLHPNTGEMKLA